MKLFSFNVVPMVVMTLISMVQISLQAPMPTTGSLNVNGSHPPKASMNHAIGTPNTVVHAAQHTHGNGVDSSGPIASTSTVHYCPTCKKRICQCL